MIDGSYRESAARIIDGLGMMNGIWVTAYPSGEVTSDVYAINSDAGIAFFIHVCRAGWSIMIQTGPDGGPRAAMGDISGSDLADLRNVAYAMCKLAKRTIKQLRWKEDSKEVGHGTA